jgi:hypothetical protein
MLQMGQFYSMDKLNLVSLVMIIIASYVLYLIMKIKNDE